MTAAFEALAERTEAWSEDIRRTCEAGGFTTLEHYAIEDLAKAINGFRFMADLAKGGYE